MTLRPGSLGISDVTPGTDATDLGKAEDSAHTSGDTGIFVLAVRNDTLAALAGTDGDYAPIQVDALGAVYAAIAAKSTGGAKMKTYIDLDETEDDVTTGPTTVYSMYFWNSTAAPVWVQLFNTNTVTVGTTAPDYNFPIPANADSDVAGVVIPVPAQGIAFSTALTVAVTGASGTDATAVGANAAGAVIVYQD